MSAESTSTAGQSAEPVADRLDESLKSVAEALKHAAETVGGEMGTAAEKIHDSMPETLGFVARAVYSTCYYGSYGVVFPTLFVAGVVPGLGPVADGLVDGAREAVAAISNRKDAKRSS